MPVVSIEVPLPLADPSVVMLLESVLLLLSPELHATANSIALAKITFFMVFFFTFYNWFSLLPLYEN
jgi:hypothetical protein